MFEIKFLKINLLLFYAYGKMPFLVSTLFALEITNFLCLSVPTHAKHEFLMFLKGLVRNKLHTYYNMNFTVAA